MKTNYLTCAKCSQTLDLEQDMESWEEKNICQECSENE